MPTSIQSIWQEAAVVAVLLIVIWSGHKGWWYWSPGVKALAKQLARERDDWRAIAVTLLRKQGVNLPDGFEVSKPVDLPGDDPKTTT